MNLVIVFFFSFFCLSKASELLFENKDETILAMGGELSLVYYIDENIDPISREAKITYSGKNFVCEVNHKEIEKCAMLYHNKIYICDLKKSVSGIWYVPELVSVTFDLTNLTYLGENVNLSFSGDGGDDHKSSFYLALIAETKVQTMIDRHNTISFRPSHPNWIEGRSVIGKFVLGGTGSCIVKLTGDINNHWSMSISWN